MKRLRGLLIALVLAALLLTMLPPAFAAGDADTPDYTKADEIFDQLYGALRGRKALADDESRADAVERMLARVDGVVEGSVRRAGNDLIWQTEDGVACRFSPYLYSLSAGDAKIAAAPEKKNVASGSRDVCLFGPYYGLDDSFGGVGGNYDSWGEILARFTGGSYRRYQRTEATIDRVADAVQSSAVVLIDSHGETDPDSRTSYICLQSGEGITSADYAYDAAAGVYHALYGGRGDGDMVFYEVDGTAIANHMTDNAPGNLLWNGVCYGMTTRGIFEPLMARGVSVVYGYSTVVTFGGDSCWMGTFMDKLTNGKNVRDSILAMKNTWGAWDFSPQICEANGWHPDLINHTAAEAAMYGDAFPIVVSAKDPYPANPNAQQKVYSDWQLPRVELSLHLVLPDGVKSPDIQGYIFYSGRLPTPSGRPRNQDYAYAFAGWSFSRFGPTGRIPDRLYRPGEEFRFGYASENPLDFGDQSATLYGVYSFVENGSTWYTSDVPDGEYDPYDPSGLFSDMPYGTWYYPNVRYALASGLVNGYTDGTFRPENTIRRSEVVSILYRAAGSPEAGIAPEFPDVPSDCWYEDAVAWAVENGIVLGYSDGRFHPDDPVTRAQLAALFCRYAGDLGNGTSAIDAFPDHAKTPQWAEAELAWAVEKGLINGSLIGGVQYLKPLDPASRCQFVTILQRYLE